MLKPLGYVVWSNTTNQVLWRLGIKENKEDFGILEIPEVFTVIEIFGNILKVCPVCEGTKKEDSVSFVDPRMSIKRMCSHCKGKGVI